MRQRCGVEILLACKKETSALTLDIITFVERMGKDGMHNMTRSINDGKTLVGRKSFL